MIVDTARQGSVNHRQMRSKEQCHDIHYDDKEQAGMDKARAAVDMPVMEMDMVFLYLESPAESRQKASHSVKIFNSRHILELFHSSSLIFRKKSHRQVILFFFDAL